MADGQMKRLLVKSNFGMGRDFGVYTDEAATNKIYSIDAKMTLGAKAYIKDSENNVIYTARSGFFNIPRKMKFIDAGGSAAANLRAHFSPIKSKLTMTLADGTEWKLEGNFVGKNYIVMSGDKKILELNQKWMTVRDKYFVEIADDVDLPLALGLIWAVDVWREGNNN